jgi:hypothetical protein
MATREPCFERVTHEMASAEYLCVIHGLVLASEVKLPVPCIEPRPADITYRIALDTTLPAPSHSRSDDAEDPWAIDHWLGTRLAVEFPGCATFELSRTEVALVADDTGDPDLVAHLLLDHVVPRVVALRGDLMLHAAGAVGPSGRAHLFLGKTGAGKSTIAAGLCTQGWALLDDDGIRVVELDSASLAVPGTSDVRLLPDSAAALLLGAPPGRPMTDGHPKRRFAVEGRQLRMAATRAPVAGVYLLERSDSSVPSVERVGLADAVSTITEHGFHMADEPSAITRHAFERASALAAAAPVWRLCQRDGLEHLDASYTLLNELDGHA